MAPVTKLVFPKRSNFATAMEVYMKFTACVAALATISIAVESAGFDVPANTRTQHAAVQTVKNRVVHFASFLRIFR